MSLSARAIALSGFGYGALEIAVSGLLGITTTAIHGGDDAPDWADKKVNDLRMKMIQDDEMILNLIMSCVTNGIIK